MTRPGRPEPVLPPPRFLLNRWTVMLAAAALVIPFLAPIPLELRRHPVISPLGDQLHVVLLAAMTLLVYWRGPLRGRLLASAVTVGTIGGLIEIVQIPFGRQANWGDVVLDLVGVGLAAGFILWRGAGRRAGLLLMIGVLMIVPWRLRHVPFVVAGSYDARESFPVLADFERRHDAWLWSDQDARVAVEGVPDTPAGPGHVLRIAADGDVDWPGARMHRFPHDWTGYDTLLVDARAVGADTTGLRFAVRLDDFAGRRDDEWISTSHVAGPAWRTFRVPLVGRKVRTIDGPTDRVFDRTDVDRIIVYLPRPDGPAVLEVDNLRLEPPRR